MPQSLLKDKQRDTSVLALNKTRLPELPRALRRVAEIVDAEPTAVTRMTVEELASRAEVSEGSVIRWCKELGFSGFQDLKLSLAFDAALTQFAASDSSTKQATIFSSLTTALSETEHFLNQAELASAAKYLCKAKQILIVGVGSSSHVAHYLQYRLLRVRLFSEVYVDMHAANMMTSLLGSKSVLVAVSSSGSTIDVNTVAQLAKAQETNTIALTNHPSSRLARTVDAVLAAAHSGDTPLAGGSAESVVTQIAVIECLIDSILKLEPDRKDALVKTAESVLNKLY